MKNRKKSEQNGVFAAIRMAAGAHPVLTAGTLLCVAGSVGASLVPPLLLARIIDRLTAGIPLTVQAVLLYFGSLALEGGLSSAQESLLVLFGQKMTHALRTEMSHKLTRLPAGMLVRQNPGEVAARFSGDVDTVEALFTSGIISMAADACRIVSILAVIAVKNTGLALILLLVLPLFALFTRHVQKRMLAAQLDNRRAVAAVSGQVPETLHNIRTIRALGLEAYREQRYDRCIGDSYAAMERTNFYDAIYSPVVLVLNAVVVGAVMLLSASGNAAVLTLFGMSVGTSVAVINYISRIFEPIESLGMEIQTIQSAMAGVKRIDAFLAQPEREQPPARATAARGDVVLDHVTFGYGEKHVLEDFSMTVKQGEQVIAIGNAGGFNDTVTVGYVSYVNREIQSYTNYPITCIQTDAALNFGNSGGALVNLYGQVVGIVVSKYSSTGSENIGFAIASDFAVPIAEDLIEKGYVSDRPRIGIMYSLITPEYAAQLDVKPGMLISEISPDCDVANTDLQKDDIITELNGKQILTAQDVKNFQNTAKAGDKVTAKVYRKTITGEVTEFEIEFTLEQDK